MAFALPAVAAFAPETAAAIGASSTFSALGAIGSAISLGSSVFGAISGGRSQAASSRYAETVAANNAQIAKQNADYAAQEGEVNAAKKERETRAKLGGLLADQGASGVDVNSGSAVDVRSSAASIGALDALTIRSNAARQAYGYETQGAEYEGEAAVDKSEASNANTSGLIKGGSTFLSGLSKLNESGAFNNHVGSKSLSSSGSYDDPYGVDGNY